MERNSSSCMRRTSTRWWMERASAEIMGGEERWSHYGNRSITFRRAPRPNMSCCLRGSQRGKGDSLMSPLH
jgi:hypothetical protein